MNEIIREKINSFLTGFDDVDKENLYNYVLEMIAAEWSEDEMRENLLDILLEKTQPFVAWLFEEMQKYDQDELVEIISLKDEDVEAEEDGDNDVVMIDPPPIPRKSVFERLGIPGVITAPLRLVGGVVAPRRLRNTAVTPQTQNGEYDTPQTQSNECFTPQDQEYTTPTIRNHQRLDPQTQNRGFMVLQKQNHGFNAPQSDNQEYMDPQKESNSFINNRSMSNRLTITRNNFGGVRKVWKKKRNRGKRNSYWKGGQNQVQNLAIIRSELQTTQNIPVQSAAPSSSVMSRLNVPPRASADTLLNAIKLLLGVYCQKSAEETINLG